MPARISTDGQATAIPPNLTPSEFARMMRLPPEQAVKFLQDKGVVVTSDWRSLWQDEHQRQFTISRLARADLLQDIQTQLARSVNGDLSRKDWMRNVEDMLSKAGWWGDIEVLDPTTGEVLTTRFNSNRLRLIYDVNTRNAYAAGQWQRFEAGKRTNPYLRYVTKRDERVRDSHKALNNLVLPVDHPFWDTHAPPNGWRCRCSLTSMSQKDYDKGLSPRGDPLNKTAPEVKTRDWYNAKTGKTERVPVGVDPGWGYNPGKVKARDAAMRTMVDDKIAKLEPGLARKVREDLARSVIGDPAGLPLIPLAAVDTEYADGVREVLTAFAQRNTEGWLPYGVDKVVTGREPNMIAATDHRGYFVLGTAPINAFNGQSGLQVITAALTKIKQGEPLSFNEEYGIETLWHEILHNSQKYTQPGELSIEGLRVVEGLHQSLARQSYPTLMTALGAQAAYQDAIRKNGMSYPKSTASYYVLLGQLGLLDASGAMLPSTEAALRDVMFNTPYNRLYVNLAGTLAKMSNRPRADIDLMLMRIADGVMLDD